MLVDEIFEAERRFAGYPLDHLVCSGEQAAVAIFGDPNDMLPRKITIPSSENCPRLLIRGNLVFDLATKDVRKLREPLLLRVFLGATKIVGLSGVSFRALLSLPQYLFEDSPLPADRRQGRGPSRRGQFGRLATAPRDEAAGRSLGCQCAGQKSSQQGLNPLAGRVARHSVHPFQDADRVSEFFAARANSTAISVAQRGVGSELC